MGCHAGAVLSAQHRILGRVQACAAHHPERAAIAVPFGRPATTPIPPSPEHPPDDPLKLAGELAALLHTILNGEGGSDQDVDGGSTVPRRPIPPTFDPEGLALEARQP